MTLCSVGAGAVEESTGAEVGGDDVVGATVVFMKESVGAAVEFELTGAIAGASVVKGANVKGIGKGAALGSTVMKGAKVNEGLDNGGPVSGSFGVDDGILTTTGVATGVSVGEGAGEDDGVGKLLFLLLLFLLLPFFFSLLLLLFEALDFFETPFPLELLSDVGL